jgi:peptidoglycan/xylan/chitin deacetylase (PgdA/CDA1 family)
MSFSEAKEKTVALTFDADMTDNMKKSLKSGRVKSWYNQKLIETLEKENIDATLFLTGEWIETYPAETKKLSENKLFEIASHSYSHPGFTNKCFNLRTIPDSKDSFEISHTDELLKQNTIAYKKYFRFPGLCSDKESINNVESQGYKIVGGDAFGEDGFERNPSKIVRNVLKNVHDKSIVILHMHGGPIAPATEAAVEKIIPALKKEGYRFVKVSEIIK